MLIVRVSLAGFRRALGSPGIVVALWLVNFVIALPLAWVMSASMRASIGSSLVHEKLRAGFDMGWFGEYRSLARGLEATFDPTLMGAGAFYQNLEDWVTGGLFGVFPGLVGVGVLYALVWALLLGGVLARFARPEDPTGAARFVQSGGRYFFRFVRLALLSAPIYWLVYKLYGLLHRWLEGLTRDVTSEKTVFLFSFIVLVLVGFLLTLVHICFAYAKFATVLEDRRSMIFAALRGIGFVLSNPGRALGVYYLMMSTSVILLLIYGWIAPGPEQSTWIGMLFAFAVGQLFLMAKLVIRLSVLAGQMALYQETGG